MGKVLFQLYGVNLGNCFWGQEWGWQFVSLNLKLAIVCYAFHRVLAVFHGVSPSHRYVVMCRERIDFASEASNGVRLSQDLVFRDFVVSEDNASESESELLFVPS